jgi:hypothetical protein
MSRSRFFSCAYINEPLVERYFDDKLMADYLLGEAKEQFAYAIEADTENSLVVKCRNFSLFAWVNGTNVAELKELGLHDEAHALFDQLCASWPAEHVDDDVSVGLPTRMQLLNHLRSYSANERKQLWEMMSEEMQNKVRFSNGAESAAEADLSASPSVSGCHVK